MQSVNENRLNYIAAEYLALNDRPKFEELSELCKPMVADIKLIPLVIDKICKTYSKKPEDTPFILAVVYYMFCKFKLHFSNARIPNGIRKELCHVMQWTDPPVVNYYAKIMQAYYKGPRFAKRVEEMVLSIYGELISDGVIDPKEHIDDGQ